jgi:hypothetical protein
MLKYAYVPRQVRSAGFALFALIRVLNGIDGSSGILFTAGLAGPGIPQANSSLPFSHRLAGI